MAEAFAFELKLIDGVTKVAERQAAAVKKVESAASRSNDVLGKQFEKIGFAAARAAKRQEDAFAASWAKIGMAAERARRRSEAAAEREHKRQERLAEKAKEHNSILAGIKEGSSRITGMLTGAFLGAALVEGAYKVGETLVEAAHKSVEVITEGVTKAFEESGKQETLRLGEKLSLGGGAGGFREDVGRFGKLTGFDDDKIRALLLPLRRAGFDQQASRTAFAAASDVAAGEGQGGNLGRVNELLNGFEHIMLKGGIGEKQLVGLGVAAKPFYTEIAKQLNLGTGNAAIEAAKKRVEEGKVNPQQLLNTIYRGIEAKQGGKLGTGTIAYSQTFEARMAKLKNLPNEFFKNFSESAGFKRASDAIGQLLERLDPESPAGQRIMGSLERAFDKITSFIGDPAAAADSIADGIDKAVYFAEQFIPSLKTIGEMLFTMVDNAASFAENIQLANAYIMRDKTTIEEITRNREDRQREKYARVIGANVERQENQKNDVAYAVNLANGMSPLTAAIGYGEKKQAIRGAVVSVQNHMTFHGVDEKTAKTIGDETHRTTTNAMERAAQEGG